MKVIGAGFGRTGTMSLKVALETLGAGPCYHMREVFEHPEHVAVWQAAGDGGEVDWGALYTGYGSAVDWPTAAFWPQLIDVYPEAKVILTVRDPERWYRSIMSTIYPASTEAPDDSTPPETRAHRRMVHTVIWEGVFGGECEDKGRALEIFHRNIEEVQRRVPAGRLLVYDVQEGWEPLCDFLGVPVPEETFPRLNDTASFQQRREDSARSV